MFFLNEIILNVNVLLVSSTKNVTNEKKNS